MKRSKSVQGKIPSTHLHLKRRSSVEDVTSTGRSFLIDVQTTIEQLLSQEDTDNNFQITIQDTGPKLFKLGSAASAGHNTITVAGNYMTHHHSSGGSIVCVFVNEAERNENPVKRLTRLITNEFWHQLTRKVDLEGLRAICSDQKSTKDKQNRIYVPHDDMVALDYFNEISDSHPFLSLEVIRLPMKITPEYVRSIDKQFGILSLALERGKDGILHGVPFVVPGGRFNEMYGWDSYFESLGLLLDGHGSLAKAMADNFCYQINYYGKILNANRSYYLNRSQPPFFMDLVCRVYNDYLINELARDSDEKLYQWLAQMIRAAMKDLFSVWLSPPRLDRIGLSKFHPIGKGVPPETEASHFTHVFEPFAKKLGMSVESYKEKYSTDEIHEPKLDEYFTHDCGVRESGHDTTYRLDEICGDLATIDLNSLIYKYEMDMSNLINEHFGARYDVNHLISSFSFSVLRGENDESYINYLAWAEIVESLGVAAALASGEWDCSWAADIVIYDTASTPTHLADSQLISLTLHHTTYSVTLASDLFCILAVKLKELVDKHLWNKERGLYFDYDCKRERQSSYESVTCMYALWAGLSSPEQAAQMVPIALDIFGERGGLVSGTRKSRGQISAARPQRQWDYPFGWAPHQMIAWKGLAMYNFHVEASEIAYRWLYMITRTFMDFNGVVPEKFDVVDLQHNAEVEYGTVGTDFKCVTMEGFGWMNASFIVGLTYLSTSMRRRLGVLNDPETVKGRKF